MAEEAKPKWNIAPYFLVKDVVASANFYRDKLGFEYARFWGDPPGFVMVSRNGATIMLKKVNEPGKASPNQIDDPEDFAWDAYVWVRDADGLYAELQEKGVKIVRSICDQDYGCRDFDVEDCNGYRICFGQAF
jgi:uncharacterized glyoxalase superfamily protein PhnB